MLVIAESSVSRIIRAANEAGAIACWLHNLALASAHDFHSFDESGFWSQHTALLERYPGIAGHYRPLFDRMVAENHQPENQFMLWTGLFGAAVGGVFCFDWVVEMNWGGDPPDVIGGR
jgi:hypothetical protein